MKFERIQWHAGVSLCVAISVAILVNYYFIQAEEIWVLMPVVATALITRGKPFWQGVLCALTMTIAVGLAGLLSVDRAIGVYIIVPITFFIAGNVVAPLTYLYLLMFILALIVPGLSEMVIRDRMVNVAIGSVIGYLAGQAIFPNDIPTLFREGLLPIFNGMTDYLRAVSKRIKQYHDPEEAVEISETRLEAILSGQGKYPEWIYETGFNPGLRNGFRYFLIRIEHVVELMMSVNCIAKRINYHEIPPAIMTSIEDSLLINIDLLNYIYQYLQSQHFEDDDNDYQSDINNLEIAVSRVLPESIELLDMHQQYVQLAALLYAIKDMRKALLELALAIKS